jgi:hypothetical protein
MPHERKGSKMGDMDIVDQIALIAGRLADLAGKHHSAMDVDKLADHLQAQIVELSRIPGQVIASKSAVPPGVTGNP